MSEILGGTQLFLLTSAMFTVGVAVLVAVGLPWLRPRLRRVAPEPRARLLGTLVAAPVVLGFGLALLCFIPGVLGNLWPELDHCMTHTHGSSLHLCFGHLSGGSGSATGWLLVAVFVGWLAIPATRVLSAARRSRRLLRQLIATAPPADSGGVRLVASARPLALVTSLDANVLMSSAMVESLPSNMLAAVVAHERAHLRRRDPRRRLIAALLAVAHLSAVKQALLSELELASEQACDDDAGAELGDRLLVARALLMVERLSAPSPSQLGCAAHCFGDSHVCTRVESLLAPAPRPVAHFWARGTVLAIGVALVALADPLHHVAEHLITLLP